MMIPSFNLTKVRKCTRSTPLGKRCQMPFPQKGTWGLSCGTIEPPGLGLAGAHQSSAGRISHQASKTLASKTQV